MAKISFKKNKPSFEANLEISLMENLLNQGLPVASSCNGQGICSKCRVKICEGSENLPPESKLEVELKAHNGVSDEERISCQTYVRGHITIDTSYW